MSKYWKPLKYLKGKIVEFQWKDLIDPQYLGTEEPTDTKYLRGDGKWVEINQTTGSSNGYNPQGW